MRPTTEGYQMLEHVRCLIRPDSDEAGQGLAEYALILALIAIVASALVAAPSLVRKVKLSEPK